MTATLAAPSEKAMTKKPSVSRRPKTRQEYLTWNPHDGFKYEWDNGSLIKLPKMITPEQFYIVKNLSRFFQTTQAFKNGDELMPEVKSATTDTQVRVPDIGYFTHEQQFLMQQGEAVTPRFAIEIISPTDYYYKVDLKLEEYFEAGVKILWHIVPETEKVYVFTASDTVKICKGTVLCSAEPIIEGFTISVNDIFKKQSSLKNK
jgi:Uma2 family endonuclease